LGDHDRPLLHISGKVKCCKKPFLMRMSLSFEALIRMPLEKDWLIRSMGNNQRVMAAVPQVASVSYFAVAGQAPYQSILSRPEQLESIRRQIDPQWVFALTLSKIWNDPRFLTVNAYEALSQWMP
jgi:hypothetical protein